MTKVSVQCGFIISQLQCPLSLSLPPSPPLTEYKCNTEPKQNKKLRYTNLVFTLSQKPSVEIECGFVILRHKLSWVMYYTRN